ncbi:hypothetical protein B0H10DRAFT_2216879 [Mycena sp. CBHHK59/15]|nr:hypothetical protein B0H10DRAFT_2216879 [Mycena sp. CBHHK59/15]
MKIGTYVMCATKEPSGAPAVRCQLSTSSPFLSIKLHSLFIGGAERHPENVIIFSKFEPPDPFARANFQLAAGREFKYGVQDVSTSGERGHDVLTSWELRGGAETRCDVSTSRVTFGGSQDQSVSKIGFEVVEIFLSFEPPNLHIFVARRHSNHETSNAASIESLANLYGFLISAWIGGRNADVPELKLTESPAWTATFHGQLLTLAEEMQTISQLTGLAKWEGSIRGKWPAADTPGPLQPPGAHSPNYYPIHFHLWWVHSPSSFHA